MTKDVGKNRTQITFLRDQENGDQDSYEWKQNWERLTTVCWWKNEARPNHRSRRNRELVDSAWKAKWKHKSLCLICFQVGTERQPFRLLHCHYFLSGGYLAVERVDIERTCSSVPHFGNDQIETSSLSVTRLSTCCRLETFNFLLVFVPPSVSHHILNTCNTLWKTCRQMLRSNNAKLSITSVSAIWMYGAQDSYRTNHSWVCKRRSSIILARSFHPSRKIFHVFRLCLQYRTGRDGIQQRCSVCQLLEPSAFIELGAETMHENIHAQTYQSLRKWAQRDSLDIYSMVIYADKLSTNEHARRRNTINNPEVAMIIARVKYIYISVWYIVFHKRDATNGSGIQVFDNSPTGHRSYDRLRYILPPQDGRDGLYQALTTEYDTNVTCTVRYSEVNAIAAESGYYTGPLYHDGQQLQSIKSKREGKEEKKQWAEAR